MTALCLALAFLAALTVVPALAQPQTTLTSPRNVVAPEAVVVLDGDTIRIDGIPNAIRLVGLNAPETTSPRCEAEARIGERATALLRQLVLGGSLAFDQLPCACPAGSEGTRGCNFGRLYSRSRDAERADRGRLGRAVQVRTDARPGDTRAAVRGS